jgi:hypothetical protein
MPVVIQFQNNAIYWKSFHIVDLKHNAKLQH